MKPLVRATALFVLAGAAAGSGEDATAPKGNYGDAPDAFVPHRQFGEPARRFFQVPPVFRGPGADLPYPPKPDAVTIGVIAPLTGEDCALGGHMLDGINMAIEEANAAGGYAPGVPFATVVRDENLAWAAAGDAAVELTFDENAWALLGAFEDSSSHVMTRVILKLETPMVNTAGVDPTLTEHAIPWLLRMRPDDRQTCYALAKRVFETDKRRRVAVFRANDRYARAGIVKFNDTARRLHWPVLIEERFEAKDASWDAQIARIRNVDPDAIVVWGRSATAGRAVKALRAAGLAQPVYGPERLAEDAFVAAAGDAAEGVVCTYPYDTRRKDDAWISFVDRYRVRFGRTPDPSASYAYDGARYLVQSIREAGLNRVRIRERLFAHDTFEGVTGAVRFDATRNNVTPSLFGHVEHGQFVLE